MGAQATLAWLCESIYSANCVFWRPQRKYIPHDRNLLGDELKSKLTRETATLSISNLIARLVGIYHQLVGFAFSLDYPPRSESQQPDIALTVGTSLKMRILMVTLSDGL